MSSSSLVISSWPRLVVSEGEVHDHVVRRVRGSSHRDHARRLLRGRRFQDRLEDLHLDVAGQQRLEQRRGRGLEDEVGAAQRARHLLELRRRLDREDLTHQRPLHRRVHEALEADVDLVDLSAGEVVDDDARDRERRAQRRVVAEAGELGDLGEAGAAEEVAPLAADRDDRDALDVRLVLEGERGAGAVHVRVEAAREAAVGGDVDEGEVLDVALVEQGVKLLGVAAAARLARAGDAGEHGAHLLGVGARRQGAVLGAPHLRRGDELHGLGDLGGVPDRVDPVADRPDLARTRHLTTSFVRQPRAAAAASRRPSP